MADRIKLGSDLSLADVWSTAHLLEPLSSEIRNHGEREPRRAAQTRRYMDTGLDLFELTTLEDCDVAVLPFHWEDTLRNPERASAARAFFQRAHELGRAVLVFYHGDPPATIDYPNAIAFKNSLHRSNRQLNEFCLPAFIADPIGTVVDQLSWRPHRPTPTVSFCGFAPPLGAQLSRQHMLVERLHETAIRLRDRVGRNELRGYSPPRYYRADAIRALEQAPDLETVFILRSVRSNHDDRDGYKPVDDSMTVDQYTHQYFDNIVQGDYVLSVRGLGNYSVRFYEALACGRIPLFINTDNVLPDIGLASWASCVVEVDSADIGKVGSLLKSRHDATDPNDFIGRQQAARQLWEHHLEMSAYFGLLHRALLEGLSDGPARGAAGWERLCRAIRVGSGT